MFQALWLPILVLGLSHVLGFDMNRNDNLVVYWGQNSYGVANPSDPGNWQKNLAFYCGDDAINTIPMAFLNSFFSDGGLPSADFSNICSPSPSAVFPGTKLPNCQFLAPDIQACQSKGKIVTLSLGGGATNGVEFSSASQAQQFGTTIWNTFLGGNSNTRPFGNAVLDGIDLDIEGGTTNFYDSFVNQIRSHAQGANKRYYITAAPQCPFPDAHLTAVLNSASFDAVYVQFYNNFCGVSSFNDPNAWNFATWDNWAKTTSKNKNVKIYVGAPAAPSAAGPGSFVDAATLDNILRQTKAKFSSFGGAMLWDASQAYGNNRFDLAVKGSLTRAAKLSSAMSKASSMNNTSTVVETSSASNSSAATKTFSEVTSAGAAPSAGAVSPASAASPTSAGVPPSNASSSPMSHNATAVPLDQNTTASVKHGRDFFRL